MAAPIQTDDLWIFRESDKKNGAQHQHPLQSLFFRIAIEFNINCCTVNKAKLVKQ